MAQPNSRPQPPCVSRWGQSFWHSSSRVWGKRGQSAAIAVGLLALTALPAIASTPKVQLPTTAAVALNAKQDSSEPTLPSRPSVIPEAILPDEAGIIGLSPSPSDDVGIGQLRPAMLPGSGNALRKANWLRGVTLPIYPSPESDHWGWLLNGWLIPNDGEPLAVGRDAAFSMVQTEQQIYAFPVLEIRPDGWFRFQYTPAGAAWAHTSHLNLGTVPLTVEPWEISMEDAARVEFRRPGLAQPMRLAPRSNAPLQALVGPNSIIQPLDIEGDWLRVRVTQPARGCTPLPGSSHLEGWVRWRSDADVPLVWFSASDC